MFLKSSQKPVIHQRQAAASMNEMQREDFLALASALRQFNAYEAQVSLVVAAAQSGSEYRERCTAE